MYKRFESDLYAVTQKKIISVFMQNMMHQILLLQAKMLSAKLDQMLAKAKQHCVYCEVDGLRQRVKPRKELDGKLTCDACLNKNI